MQISVNQLIKQIKGSSVKKYILIKTKNIEKLLDYNATEMNFDVGEQLLST